LLFELKETYKNEMVLDIYLKDNGIYLKDN